jgi:hypothetical protein
VTPEVAIKGQSLRQNFEVLHELFGAEVTSRITASLEPEFRRLAESGGLLPSGWYPVSWANELYRVAMQMLPSVLDLPERVARRGVERDMNGIYGFFARLLSPEFCIRQAPRIFGTYYRGAKLSAQVTAPGHAELHFVDCIGFSRSLWRDAVAASSRVFEESGARRVQTRFLEGGGEGDSTARVTVRWE